MYACGINIYIELRMFFSLHCLPSKYLFNLFFIFEQIKFSICYKVVIFAQINTVIWLFSKNLAFENNYCWHARHTQKIPKNFSW